MGSASSGEAVSLGGDGHLPLKSYGALEVATPSSGLSAQEAARRLAQHGPNKLEGTGKESFFSVLLRQLLNLIFILTTLSSIICYMSGDNVKGTFLISLVGGVCLLNAIGEYTGQNPSEELLKLMREKAVVMRDGERIEVDVEQLVVGDLVHLTTGDMVPADLRVIESIDLQTNEATLTGEANEVSKTVDAKEEGAAFPTNMLFKSTGIVAGSGIGQVVSTGMNTQVGLIAKRLNADGRSAIEKVNPLQRSINMLGSIIGAVCAGVIIAGTVVSYVSGYQSIPAACQASDEACLAKDAVLRGLLMAVAIIPHGLPFVTTVMLRVGARIMAEHKAVVTRQSAVDFLGAANVICTDKTGTLTEGKMAAKVVFGLLGGHSSAATPVQLAFYPLRGLDPAGGVFEAGHLTPEACAALDAGREVSGVAGGRLRDLREEGAATPLGLLAKAVTAAAFLGSHGVKLHKDPVTGGWVAEGNMSEAALKVAAGKAGLCDEGDGGKALVEELPRDASLEVAFTSRRKMSATLHRLPASKRLATLRFSESHSHVAIIKGAPDQLLPFVNVLCDMSGDLLSVCPSAIADGERRAIEEENWELARQALRSLLLAVRPLAAAEVESLRAAAGAEERLTMLLAPGPLAFLGLWGIFDPPRASVRPSVQLCRQAGIRIVMITGDQRPTAVAIAKLVGIIPEDADDTLLAHNCAELSLPSGEYRPAEEISLLATSANVWSRARPADKVTLVRSLIDTGKVATMTGDGVNDAPALKLADVGVAMGISGTAVSKNAAAMVLMDDNFSTIVWAVREGRKIYGNIQKYMTFLFCLKGSECCALLLAIVLRFPLPMEGLQQLVNLLASHIVPPTALAWEDAEDYVMRIPPRQGTNDLVVNRIHMLYRWLPWVICHASLITAINVYGTYIHTGFISVDALRGSSFPGAVDLGQSPCAVGGQIVNGEFLTDPAPYMCRCSLKSSFFQGSREVVEQWGRPDATSQPFDEWTGSTGSAFSKANSPFADATNLLAPCEDRWGRRHMCWRLGAPTVLPLLSPKSNCAAYGARLGHAITYASIQLSEIAALVTFRTDGPFWRAKFSGVYASVVVINLAVLACVLYVRSFAHFLKLAPLTFTNMLLASVLPITMVVLCECTKVVYRSRLQLWHQQLCLAHEGMVSPGKKVEP